MTPTTAAGDPFERWLTGERWEPSVTVEPAEEDPDVGGRPDPWAEFPTGLDGLSDDQERFLGVEGFETTSQPGI